MVFRNILAERQLDVYIIIAEVHGLLVMSFVFSILFPLDRNSQWFVKFYLHLFAVS